MANGGLHRMVGDGKVAEVVSAGSRSGISISISPSIKKVDTDEDVAVDFEEVDANPAFVLQSSKLRMDRSHGHDRGDIALEQPRASEGSASFRVEL